MHVSPQRVAARFLTAKHSRRLYHGTSSENLKAIRRGGLAGDPAKRLFENEVDAPMPGHVYLTPDPGLAGNYAGRASRKFGGDPMVLVFHVDPNDKRLVADEDWLASVRGYLIESGMTWYQGDAYRDLSNIVALYKGRPQKVGLKPGTPEHANLLVQLTYQPMSMNLAEYVKGATQLIQKAAKEPQGEPTQESMEKVGKFTKELQERFEQRLHKIAPHPWVKPDRILAFVLDPFLHELANDPGKFGGTRREAWTRLQKELVSKWPEWFEADAAIISQHGGSSRAIALKTRSIMPVEAWVIDRPGRVNSYQDLGRLGVQVW